MKTNFIITLPNKTEDPKGILKNFLAKRIMNKYSHLTVAGIDNPINAYGIQYAGPKDAFTFGASDKHDVSWIAEAFADRVPTYKNFNLYSEFFSAMDALDKYAKSEKAKKDNFDGMLFDKPYKVYDSFVQIGNKIIPKYNESYFNNNFDDDYKTDLTLITIKIKSFLG